MEPRKPPEFGLEVSADRTNIKDVIKGTGIALTENATKGH